MLQPIRLTGGQAQRSLCSKQLLVVPLLAAPQHRPRLVAGRADLPCIATRQRCSHSVACSSFQGVTRAEACELAAASKTTFLSLDEVLQKMREAVKVDSQAARNSEVGSARARLGGPTCRTRSPASHSSPVDPVPSISCCCATPASFHAQTPARSHAQTLHTPYLLLPMQMSACGGGRHLGISINWSMRWRADGSFLEEIKGKHLGFKWGYDGRPDSTCWEVSSCWEAGGCSVCGTPV